MPSQKLWRHTFLKGKSFSGIFFGKRKIFLHTVVDVSPFFPHNADILLDQRNDRDFYDFGIGGQYGRIQKGSDKIFRNKFLDGMELTGMKDNVRFASDAVKKRR